MPTAAGCVANSQPLCPLWKLPSPEESHHTQGHTPFLGVSKPCTVTDAWGPTPNTGWLCWGLHWDCITAQLLLLPNLLPSFPFNFPVKGKIPLISLSRVLMLRAPNYTLISPWSFSESASQETQSATSSQIYPSLSIFTASSSWSHHLLLPWLLQ